MYILYNWDSFIVFTIYHIVKHNFSFRRRICSVVTIWIEQYPRDFDEPTDYVSLNQLIHFCQQRTQVPVVEKLYQVCDGKLNTLTVSPFDDESKSLFILLFTV